jgi:hypothetical protein
MEQGTRDVTEITADLLQANDRKLAENQAKLQVALDEHESHFNAELAALVPLRQNDAAKNLTGGCWRESAGVATP